MNRTGERPGAVYARCPGCGDHGDAAHIAACVLQRDDRVATRAWRRGAEFVLAAVKTQLGRTGAVDVAKLADAIEALATRAGVSGG